MSQDVPQEIVDHIMNLNKKTPYHRLLDMNITSLAQGFCEAKLTVSDKHINPIDMTHGGVAFSILDLVSGNAARTLSRETATIEMNINYLAPSYIGDELVAQGRILKQGKRVIVAEGKLYKNEEVVAISRQSMINLRDLLS